MAQFSSYLPSKSFTLVVVSMLVAVFLIAAAFRLPGKSSGTLATTAAQPNLERVEGIVAGQDTDGDGLKDWEETLWKSNPYEKDTDGDGTSDGTEVKASRNPVKAGPNDKLQSFAVSSDSSAAQEGTESLTATDIIARDLFSRYTAAKQSGGGLDKPTENQIISSILARKDLAPTGKTYVSGDIRVSAVADSAPLKIYGNAMGAVVKRYAIGNENELIIFERAVKNDDPEELKKLDPIIGAYEGMLREMLAVTVPKPAVSVHLSLLNSMNGVLLAIRSIRSVYEDPASALLSLASYLRSVDALGSSLTAVKTLFKTHAVPFSKDEDGFHYANLAQ